jgi:hypothetical protein
VVDAQQRVTAILTKIDLIEVLSRRQAGRDRLAARER